MVRSAPVRVCVVGLGRAGMVHAMNFRGHVPGATLAAVVEADREVLEARAAELEVEFRFETLQEALAGAVIDAVCITTPTFTHAELAIAAASAGRHIFCEKPMALTLEEADAMIRAAGDAGVVLQIGFMRRFDPAFLKARRLIEEGEIGRPMVIRSLTRGPGLPPRWAWDLRRSNGMLAEVNSHDFDAVRWMAGSDYTRVYAETAASKRPDLVAEFPEFYDSAVVTLRLASGALATIDGGCPVDYGYDARMEILGTAGVVRVGEAGDSAVLVTTRESGTRFWPFASWRDRFREAYVAEAEQFVACIREGATPLATGKDGRKALEAVIAANRSSLTGMPVSLPIDGGGPEVRG